MRKPRALIIAGVLTLLSAGSAYAWNEHLRGEMFERFGPSPALGVSPFYPGDSACQQVDSVSPPAHYTWLGRIWQEESLDWSDVQVQHPPPREFAHNHSGPVKVGDIICGFGEVSDIRYVHRPTGIVLTETCESYRCPLE